MGSSPRPFEPVEAGSGIFGKWILDDAGLPAYEYTLDQYADERARYPTVDKRERRDHWHQIGNDEITALASNDGTVQVYVGHRGGRFLNRYASHTDAILRTQEMPSDDAPTPVEVVRARLYRLIGSAWLRLQLFIRRARTYRPIRPPVSAQTVEPAINPRGTPVAEPISGAAQAVPVLRPTLRRAHAGGFGYVDDGEQVWCTAYRFRPFGAETRRVFGMGYVEYVTTYRDLRVTRRVYAAPTAPLLLIDVEIANLRPDPAHIRYYEYWDVNVEQLKLQWLRGDPFYAFADEERLSVNDLFLPEITLEDGRALRFHQTPAPLPADIDAINDIDYAPYDIVLRDLGGMPDGYYTDKIAFFGKNPPGKPEAVAERWGTIPNAPSTDSMPYCMVMRHDLTLEPNATRTLRFAYGIDRATAPVESAAALDAIRARFGDSSLYFNTGQDAALTRELAWHSYYLNSATVYNEYYATHLTPQGSAYLYIHGADGAPRDQALFALPLVYIRPDLARANLRLIMALTDHRTGAIPYSFAGYGYHSDAFIHDAPSDLDLFFLLALNEYLAATGDFDFLKTEVPFYTADEPPMLPPAAHGITVLDHVRAAVHHLSTSVGIGEHGLLKIGDGDWSDGVVFDTCKTFGGIRALSWFSNSKAHGESVPNSQMALYVLPITAALLKPYDPEIDHEIAHLLQGLEAAIMRQWNGKWFTRAILRDSENRPVVVDYKRINLEAQPWALISGLSQRRGVESTLIHSIKLLLDDPSPTGAMLLENGMIWAAVSQLLTWGYTRTRPDLAWRSLLKHTFATHAETFPNIWFNLWSGPDGVNSKGVALNPGGTWSSAATPMTDFPVMNMNPHAMALLGALRVCGIEPTADGLLIQPHVPRERFELDTALLSLKVTPDAISGEYRPIIDHGAQTLILRMRGGEKRLKLTFSNRQPISFQVPLSEFR